MRYAALASGSSGNSFVVESNNELILFDAGISARQIFTRLKALKLNPEKISAIFISHEHTDHISGVPVLLKKTRAKLFITKKTFMNSRILNSIEQEILDRTIFINPDSNIEIKNNIIKTFTKKHDAIDPISFLIKNEKTLSIITDIGKENNKVINAIKESDATILESNYDKKMLETGTYPIYLKQRISSDYGHLSNEQAVELINNYASEKLENIMLAHLSIINNTEELARKTFETKLINTRIKSKLILSTRYKPTELITLK